MILRIGINTGDVPHGIGAMPKDILMISITDQPRHSLSAWGLSFCIHAITVAGGLVLFHNFPQTQPSVYRMEILLTDPHSEQETVAPRETSPVAEDTSAIASPPPPTTGTSSTHATGQQALGEPSIARRTRQDVPAPLMTPPESNRQTTASDSVIAESPVPTEQHSDTVTPLVESLTSATANSPRIIEHHLTEAAASSIDKLVAMPVDDDATPTILAAPDHSKNPVEADSVAADSANPLSASPGDRPAPSPPTDHASTVTAHTDSQPGIASFSSSHMNSDHPAVPSPQTVAMHQASVVRSTPSRPDYGWLKDLLKHRLMGLLTYPRIARMQGWEGIVVVRTTIKNDGSLLEAVVTESSGYTALDEDALKLLHRACPIHLPHDLGRSQIEVLVPIHYKLER